MASSSVLGPGSGPDRSRGSLRATGLRPIRIWVPDTRAPGFAEECKRQSRVLADDPHERDILDWMAAATDTDGWS